MSDRETTVIATRLPLALADAIYRKAREQHTTASSLIRRTLEDAGIIRIVDVRPMRRSTRRPTNRPCPFTYFIGDGNGKVKIGASDDPEKRLLDLQPTSSSRLVLLLVIEGNYEVELQTRFEKDRLHFEWFTFSDEIRDFLSAQQLKSHG